MTEGIFMQLLVLVLMLMMSGKNANMKELKPIIEELGGGAAAEAFKQAEELSGMITAMQSLAKMSEPPAPPPETAIVHLLRPLRGRRQKKSRDGVVFPDDNSYICRAMQQQMRHSASGDYLNIKRRDEFHA